MIVKTIVSCEKLKNKLSNVAECSLTLLLCPWKKNSLGGGEEKYSTKNKEECKTSTHKNNHDMESISLRHSSNFSNKSIVFAIIFHLFIEQSLNVEYIGKFSFTFIIIAFEC